jgi:hypothetical protein
MNRRVFTPHYLLRVRPFGSIDPSLALGGMKLSVCMSWKISRMRRKQNDIWQIWQTKATDWADWGQYSEACRLSGCMWKHSLIIEGAPDDAINPQEITRKTEFV